MKQFIKWLDSEHNEGLHELMTNQVYTAVLGTIIYMLFDWVYKIYINRVFNFDIFIRTAYLLVGIAFYLSDFYYIKNSKPYRIWYFLFDLVFMICMLYSAKVLNIEYAHDVKKLPPFHLGQVRYSYIIFLVLYTFWDIRELISSYRKKEETLGYFIEVIIWDFSSLAALFLIPSGLKFQGLTLLIILILSTIWFGSIATRKSTHESFITREKLQRIRKKIF